MSLAYRINDAKVIHEIIDGDAIMINLDNGNYYSMNESGAYAWSLLQQGAARTDIIRLLAERFSLSVTQGEEHAEAFISHLFREELISEHNESCDPASLKPLEGAAGTYTPPQLLVFSDMQELLLLDPIHEISEQGWPHIQKK
jgi:hypothetical protein